MTPNPIKDDTNYNFGKHGPINPPIKIKDDDTWLKPGPEVPKGKGKLIMPAVKDERKLNALLANTIATWNTYEKIGFNAPQMKVLIDRLTPQLKTLLAQSNQQLREDLEIQHTKELEECIEFTTKDVLDRVLAKLPKKDFTIYQDSYAQTYRKGVNDVLDQCKKIIKELKWWAAPTGGKRDVRAK